ncbi:beta-1,4-glucuronyltransferase 1-like isoform X2 [Macrobrachium nipponense]
MTTVWVLLVLINLLVMFVNLGYVFTNKQEQQQQQHNQNLQGHPRLLGHHRQQQPYYAPNESPNKLMVQENFALLRGALRDSPQNMETLKNDSRTMPAHETHTFALRGDDWEDLISSWPVCLSTQASADLLFWVGEHIKTWSGPMSVAVYVPDSDFYVAMKMIEVLLSCSEDVRRRVSFHVTYPAEFPPKAMPLDNPKLLAHGCDQLEMYNEYLLSEMNGTLQSRQPAGQFLYPQNLLRNIARDNCKTDYVFTPDVDMVLVAGGIDVHLKSFLDRPDARRCRKCAFIIPAYEISTEAPHNPVDKSELLLFLKKNKLARRFHVKIFKPNQANSQLKLWERPTAGKELKGKKDRKQQQQQQQEALQDSLMREANGTLRVLYDVTTWQNFWEPVYVARAPVPPFDERFVGYGCTRSSQIYEMHVAGFSWRVLNDAFLCHRGFQDRRARELWGQINRNFNLYQDFKREVDKKYGEQVKKQKAPEEI